jgi:hypothetical protein
MKTTLSLAQTNCNYYYMKKMLSPSVLLSVLLLPLSLAWRLVLLLVWWQVLRWTVFLQSKRAPESKEAATHKVQKMPSKAPVVTYKHYKCSRWGLL